MTRAHPWIATARAIRLPGPPAREGLVAVLGAAGLRELRSRGHAAAAATCAPGLDPADVRFVDSGLTALLSRADAGELLAWHRAPWPDRPVILAATRQSAAAARIELRIPPDLRCLRGHFAHLPIVPGAIQLGWATGFAAELLGSRFAAAGYRSVKFHRVTLPGQTLELELQLDPRAGWVRFTYASAAGRHSTGSIRTGPNE